MLTSWQNKSTRSQRALEDGWVGNAGGTVLAEQMGPSGPPRHGEPRHVVSRWWVAGIVGAVLMPTITGAVNGAGRQPARIGPYALADLVAAPGGFGSPAATPPGEPAQAVETASANLPSISSLTGTLASMGVSVKVDDVGLAND